MGFKKRLKKILNLGTQKTSSGDISKVWVYKKSIRDAEVFFETGRFTGDKEAFTAEFNQLFNQKEINIHFNKDVDRLRIVNKINELRAIYYSLAYCEGENAKAKYEEYFGEDYIGKKQLERINKKAKFYIDKLKVISQKEKNNGITFPELVVMVESSRGINIDREMKLFEFHRIYELELKRWQKEK